MSLTKLAAQTSWITTFDPPGNTTTWSKGLDKGCFYRSPLRVWTDAGMVFPGDLVADYSARLRHDFELRGGFLLDADGALALLDPKLDPVKPIAETHNPWDPMHFGILPIYEDLARRGETWAWSAMLTLLGSYFENVKFPYLCADANATQPGGTQGRLRNFGWGGIGLACASREFKRLGIFGVYGDALVAVVNNWINVVRTHWPLTADPDGPGGDHLDVPHLETFMVGILGEALNQLATLGYPCFDLALKAADLVEAARIGIEGVEYVYDLRVDAAGNPLPPEPTDQRVVGWGGTNSWLTGALRPESGEYLALLDAARSAQAPTKYPAAFAQLFGLVE